METYMRIPLPQDWSEWKIEELLGSGSYGVVYRASKQVVDEVSEEAAIKIITIPSDENERSQIEKEYPDFEERERYLNQIAGSVMKEIRFMALLKDGENIVSLDDYSLQIDSVTRDRIIFIRMELLTCVNDYFIENEANANSIAKMGVDLCKALKYCQSKSILHRDIKPENIFIDSKGCYKLGDFGIATLDVKGRPLANEVGTPVFMAPEVYHGGSYSNAADQYSLGIVLYRFLNNNREPFIDNSKRIISKKDRALAFEKRMAGETIPLPVNAPFELGKIICKACSYNPSDRFDSIYNLENELNLFLYGKSQVILEKKDCKSGSKKLFVVISVLIVCIAMIGIGFFSKLNKDVQVNEKEIKILMPDDIYIKCTGKLYNLENGTADIEVEIMNGTKDDIKLKKIKLFIEGSRNTIFLETDDINKELKGKTKEIISVIINSDDLYSAGEIQNIEVIDYELFS